MRATALKVEPQAVDSVSDPWTLTVTDMTLVRGKAADGRLAFGMLLLFFRRHGRFPNAASEIDALVIASIAKQLRVPVEPLDATDAADRTLKRHRAEIRSHLGFREATVADAESLADWLRDHAVADRRDMAELADAVGRRCREIKIEPPASERIERIVRAALHAYDERFCEDIHGRLPMSARSRLDAFAETCLCRAESCGKR